MIYTLKFSELNQKDFSIAGGKGASLGEMFHFGILVPAGFVVLTHAFDKAIGQNITKEIERLLRDVSIKSFKKIENVSNEIQSIIKSSIIPQEIADSVLDQFDKLDSTYVAVRSSATLEDSDTNAWAGQLDSYLSIKREQVLKKVQECWASLYTPRAIFYGLENGLNTKKISIAVVIQSMVDSESSGVAFTVHPVTEDKNKMIIEAGFGLGEPLVSGQVTPDSYVVTKVPRKIMNISVSKKTKGLFQDLYGGTTWRDLGEDGLKQVLTREQINELSDIILRIENHYGFPCDIEWAFSDECFYIVQSRPITTLK